MDLAPRTMTRRTHPPLASPASASSSTLITITTPLPAGRSKESLRLPSFPSALESASLGDAGNRPRPRPQMGVGIGTAPLPTRMSASGFVEPHHSNVPRRVRTRTQKDTQTKTREGSKAGAGTRRGGRDEDRDSETEHLGTEREGVDRDGDGNGRGMRELRRSVKEALTPGRRWSDSDSDSEGGDDGDDDKDDGQRDTPGSPRIQQDAITSTLTTFQTQSLPASQSIYAHSGTGISGTPGRPGPTPTSSRNLNTERTPLHLLSLRLPPSPIGDDAGPILASAPAVVAGRGPIQTQSQVQVQAYRQPHTAPAAADGAFPVLPQTPLVLQTSILPQQPTSSLRPATLPRRRKPTPTPATLTPAPAPAPSAKAAADVPTGGAAASQPPPAPSVTPPRPSASGSVSHHAHTPTPGPGPGSSSIQTPGAVGVRFHGHDPSSGSSSSSSSAAKGSPRPRRAVERQPTPNKRVELLRSGFDNEGAEGRVRVGRRNTVSAGASASGTGKERETGRAKVKGERSRSLANPRSRTRSRARSTQRDVAAGSTSHGLPRSNAKDIAKEQERTAASEERRAEREKRRGEREAKRVVRRKMEERMCVQRVGSRGRVDVAFFVDVDVDEEAPERGEACVLLQVVEPESDDDLEDDEDEWDSDFDLEREDEDEEGATPITATPLSSEIRSQPAVPPTPTPMPGPITVATRTKEAEDPPRTELRLYLPADLSTHIDGVSALSAAQVREGCEFIQGVLSTSASDKASATSRPRRVRVVAPRARPEDAWAIALCYQAGVDNTVTAATSTTTAAATTITATTTTSTTMDADSPSTPTLARPGAARLIATTNTGAHAQVSESTREAVRRLSVPVPVPPLALVRGEDGEVEGVVEVALDVEALDGPNVIAIDGTALLSLTLPPALNSNEENADFKHPGPGPDSDTDSGGEKVEEETYMLHPTYAYSAIHRLAMRLLDEGAGEWHTRGRQWEERVERMLFTAGAAVATGVNVSAVKGANAGASAVRVDLEVRRRVRDERHDEGSGDEGDSQSEEEDEYDDWEEEEDVDEDVKSAGARQGSESTGERETDGHPGGGEAAHANDDGEYERGRSHDPHTRMGQGHHGVPMPSKYAEPSSAFVSSAHGRSKSRARSKSKAEPHSKSRARSMSISASASKANGRRRKSRLSMSYDPFLDDGDDGNENGVVDKVLTNARRAEQRRLRLMQHRARKEEEEVQAYGGIRTEWRGVLSFDGLQKLVGVWTPASAAH